MSKQRFQYTGKISLNLKNEIYLHVDQLKQGTYTLVLMDKNKVLKKINFNK